MPVTTVQPTVKDLHLFSTLSELQNEIDNIPKISLLHFRRFIESADKLYDHAKLNQAEGDEETAYLLYMRAISLYQKSRAAKDYNSKLDAKYWESMCSSKFKRAISICETLLSSLTRRYNLLKEVKDAHLKEAAELEQLQNEQVEFGRDRSVILDFENNAQVQADSVINGEMKKTVRSIEPNSFYKMLQRNEVLVLDIRPEGEFGKCHIKNSYCLNIPPRILDVERVGYKIENSLHVGDRPTFRKRQTINNIVLLDWDCRAKDLERKGTRLRILYDALNEFDLNVPKNPTYVLDGGLKAFIFSYPAYVTNSSYTFRLDNGDRDNRSMEKSIDSLLYPDLPRLQLGVKDQKHKDASKPSVPNRQCKPNSEVLAESSVASAANSASTSSTHSVNIAEELNEDISLKHGQMMSLLDTMSEKFAKVSRLHDENTTESDYESGSTSIRASDEIRRKYERLKDDYDVKSRQCAQLERELDVQKLRAKKPNLTLAEKSKEIKRELEELKDRKDACLHEIQRIDIGEDSPRSQSTGKQLVDRSSGDDSIEATDENRAQLSLKRTISSPNIAKSPGRDWDEVVEGKISIKPIIPDRSTKPRDTVATQANLVQENEYFYKALRSISGPMAAVSCGATGLRNLGNSCYMNSVVQCLSNTDCLRQYFMIDGRYRSDINYHNKLGSGGTVARNFAVLLASLWTGQFKYISPTHFKHVVGSLAPAFANFEQQDAQEFLVFLLCALHEDLNKVHYKIAIPDEISDDLCIEVAGQKVWQNFLTNDQSVIIDNFYGQFASIMKCSYCGNTSRNFEAFMSLTVPIPETAKRCTLQDCLQRFLSPERLSSDCSVYCSKCQIKRETFKRMMLWRLPSVLIIHFNRFKTVGRLGEKIKTFVDFPVSELNLGSVPGVEIPSAPYRLYGIINHYGSMESGHYTAICKQRDNWYRFDDQEVSVISQGSIKTDAAYLLFYAAC